MSKKDPKWKLVEKVVALLEKSISPDTIIEYDVRLPDLTSTRSRKRQCDIVIRSGKTPRETITIIEVQDRKSKFDITTFDGMCTKMRKVGAQHLICVSTRDFPESIEEAARKIGPTVRLMTLKELEKERFPLNIIDNSLSYVDRKILKIKNAGLGCKEIPDENPTFKINCIAPLFEYEGSSLSVFNLVDKYLNDYEQGQVHLEDGIYIIPIRFPEKNKKLWYLKDKSRTEVILTFVVEVEIKTYRIPIKFLSYKQTDTVKPLAWMMETKGTFKGKEVGIKFILTPIRNREYHVKIFQIPKELKGRLEIIRYKKIEDVSGEKNLH